MKAFPEDEIIRALESWWGREVETQNQHPFSSPGKKGTLYELLPTIDSLTMVNALLLVEEHVGFELPACIVKRGGYSSREEMVSHLVPRIRSLFESKCR